jgi:Cu/Ag efflux pump CusA
VEFARDIENEGKPRLEAVIEACRLRLRPILMTSFAFILGVLPLVMSTGSGSEMRQAVGVAVFFGMLGVTLFGLIFTPIFYMIVRGLADRRAEACRVTDCRTAVYPVASTGIRFTRTCAMTVASAPE